MWNDIPFINRDIRVEVDVSLLCQAILSADIVFCCIKSSIKNTRKALSEWFCGDNSRIFAATFTSSLQIWPCCYAIGFFCKNFNFLIALWLDSSVSPCFYPISSNFTRFISKNCWKILKINFLRFLKHKWDWN